MNKLYNVVALLTFIIWAQNLIAQKQLPELNKKIVEYTQSVIGTQVDRGECWDLANQALTRFDAKWDLQFKYGKLLNPKKDTVLPGDIIQFKNVKLEYKSDDGMQTTTETMGQHTAIVYKVIAPGEYEIAHQNTSFSGRKVGVSKLILSTIKKGKIYIYRPVKL